MNKQPTAITFEQINTEWFDELSIRLPNYKVGRVNYGNGRSYVRLLDGHLEEPFRLYTSLTTAINTCSPMERGLLEWYVKLGLPEAERQLKMSQHYGTLMHKLIGEYLLLNCFDFDTIESKVSEYISIEEYYQPETKEWANKLQYDLVAFIQFAQDYQVVPLGVEYVLLSSRGFGTLIDLVCEMTIEEKGFFGEVYKSGERKGEPKETKRDKRIKALINFKSGRHAFYRSNGIQVNAEKQLWEENFPDIPLEAAYNWSPKEWIVSPDYNFKDWSGEIEQQEIDSILSLAEIRYATKAINKKYISIAGMAYKHIPVTGCISNKTAEEWCRAKYTSDLGAVIVSGGEDGVMIAEGFTTGLND